MIKTRQRIQGLLECRLQVLPGQIVQRQHSVGYTDRGLLRAMRRNEQNQRVTLSVHEFADVSQRKLESGDGCQRV